MFNLSLEAQNKLDTAYMFYFPDEAPDEEYVKAFLGDLKYMLEDIPSKFHPAILDGTFLENQSVYQEYLAWCEQIIMQYQDEGEQAYRNRQLVVEKLSESGADVFRKTLHDGEILHIERVDDNVKLLFDMSSGFTSQAIIELTFLEAIESGELNRYYIYDELIETEEGFGLRVISGAPNVEWTIFFKDVTAINLFRPKAYAEREQGITWNQFEAELNSALRYYIVQQNEIVEIQLTKLEQRGNEIYVGDILLGNTAKQAIKRIYCDTYEEPYAHFSEMVPVEELEEAALSDDPVLRVRAFNTMFEQGATVASIVNRVLRVIEVEEHDKMLIETIASHFYKLGQLDEDVKLRWL